MGTICSQTGNDAMRLEGWPNILPLPSYFLKHSCRLVGTNKNENKNWGMSIFRRNVVFVISFRYTRLQIVFNNPAIRIR
jgi:hypothetical protein